LTILVTGASGQFGRSAAERLLSLVPASDLVLTTRTPDALADLAARGVDVRRADFDDSQDSLAEAFRDADTLLLISTLSVGKRVEQHGRAVAAAVQAGVRHVIYTSFVGVPGSKALVAGEHAGTEDVVRASGLTWTFLRNSWYTEAITDVIAPMSLAMGVWRGSAADGRVAMVSRADCVAAAVAVCTTPGHENVAYAITGPAALSCPEAAAVIGEVAGTTLGYQAITDDDLYAQFDAMGVPRQVEQIAASGIPWCSDDMVSFERAIRQGELALTSDHVLQLTGTAPRSLHEVLVERLPAALAAAAQAPAQG
jgi:NAD(P)H dehydrogenase (quinone)